jgi:uncharacterized transporter YbjL
MANISVGHSKLPRSRAELREALGRVRQLIGLSRESSRRPLQFRVVELMVTVLFVGLTVGLIRFAVPGDEVRFLVGLVLVGLLIGGTVGAWLGKRGVNLLFASLLGMDLFFFGFLIIGSVWLCIFP